MDPVKRVRQFISHFYTKYLVAIELYMVEPWERALIHFLLAVVFALFWYFNYSIVVNMISKVRDTIHHVEEL